MKMKFHICNQIKVNLCKTHFFKHLEQHISQLCVPELGVYEEAEVLLTTFCAHAVVFPLGGGKNTGTFAPKH